MLPYAMKSKVGEEIDKLLAEGIVETVECADRAAHVVAVLKNDHKSF